MTYQQDANIKLKQQQIQQAVAFAMQGKWQDAIATDKLILETAPKDVEALNRMGRAYMELGEYPQAKEAYQSSLAVDPYNSIAKRNLDRLSTLSKKPARPGVDSHHADPHSFIEEIGKAGVVELTQIASKDTLAQMVAGDIVNLKIEKTGLFVENAKGERLGKVEPRIAIRLIKLMQGGNRYSTAVVNSSDSKITVIIREVFQDPSQATILSFPPRGLKSTRQYINGKPFHADSEFEELNEDANDLTEMYDDNDQ